MRFLVLVIFVGLISPFDLRAQTSLEDQVDEISVPDKILWLNLEEAEEKSAITNRKVMLFLFTDWCVWCKRMEETTFKNNSIANYINSNFYPVKFDAEQQKAIEFQNKNYSFQDVEPRGVHELAMELMAGRITYPTIAFFDEEWELIQSIPNFHSADKFEQIITYFAEDFFKKTPWTSYQKNYVPIDKRK